VLLQNGRGSHGLLRFGEGVDRPQPAALDEALGAGRIDARNCSALEKIERDCGAPVDELGAELDRDGKAVHAPGIAAPADALASFENDNRAPGPGEFRGRGKSSCAGADYEDFGAKRRNSQGRMISKAVIASSDAEIG
jgi:hypothetical protein